MRYQVTGFVGLGQMGKYISKHIVAAGYNLIAYDTAGTEDRAPQGARIAHNVEEMAEAEVVFLSLPDGDASKEVCSKISGVSNKRTQVVVDLSTIGITAAQECAELLQRAGIAYVDSPVSGGQKGAIEGNLTLMIAAEEKILNDVRPLLATFGENIFHIGQTPGQGQCMKLINNFLAGAIMYSTCEAVMTGVKFGLDMKQMIDVINVSTGSSFMSRVMFPECVIKGTYHSGFAMALLMKDLKLYHESIKGHLGIPHELSDKILELYSDCYREYGNEDSSYLFKYLLDKSKVY